MATISQMLTSAARHHEAGDLQKAADLYGTVLQAEPHNADVLHVLGLMAYQCGQYERALEFVSTAIALDGARAPYHNSLAAIHRARGELNLAVTSYVTALRLQPDCVEVHNNLGVCLMELGSLSEAVQCYQAALRLRPDYADAHNNLGNLLLSQGHLAAAAACFRQAVRCQPNLATAHNNLGNVLRQQDKFDEAIVHYQHALRGQPNAAIVHNNLGLTLEAQGKLDQAIHHYREAVRLQPDLAAAHNSLGNVLRQKGDFAQALVHYQHALRGQPDAAVVYNNLGIAFRAQGKLDEAIDNYRQAIRLEPNLALAHNNLGNALREQGKLDEAVASFQEALRCEPSLVDAHDNLGLAYMDLDRLGEAIVSFREALQLQPMHAETHNHLGRALAEQGKFVEALIHYQHALELKPDLPAVHNDLANVLLELGKLEEAVGHYEHVLALQPNDATVHSNLGNALKELGKLDQAAAHFRKALTLQPAHRHRVLLATLLPPIYQSLDELHERRRQLADNVRRLREEGVTLDLTREIVPVLFHLAYQGLNDRDILRDVARLYTAPFQQDRPSFAGPEGGSRKIRVGFVSRCFCNHIVGKVAIGMISRMSRADFSVSVLSVGSRRDETAGLIQEHADHYVDVPVNLPIARQLIRQLELDVLIYTDIGMDPMTYSLAFSRLAPIQCVLAGHPVTTGIDTIDYFISSKLFEVEGAQEHYTEKLIQFETMPCYFSRPAPPEPRKGREAFGLAADWHLYGCLQSLFKLHPECDALFGEILRRDERAHLVLIHGKYRHWDELLMRRFAQTIPEVVDRIHFLPPQVPADFRSLIAACDVMLDPLHFGGGTTSYECFALGAPVVTLPSQFLRGRVTLAMYKKMGVLECVAADAQGYVDMAVKLGTEAGYRHSMQAKILEACPVLFEDVLAVRELERFCIEAVSQARSSQGG
jgi:tetratricopeptide (TPR) repeat protein